MFRRVVIASIFLLAAVVFAPDASACGFYPVGSTTISWVYDGVTESHTVTYYQWVNCGTEGGNGPVYDPTPPGGTYGPPPPPPPPVEPPVMTACMAKLDQCTIEYMMCMNNPSDGWFDLFPKCGIQCRESCRVSMNACKTGVITDDPSCGELWYEEEIS